MTQTPAPPGLATPLQFIKGVGPRRAEQLGRKELRTVEDALFFLPLRHEDRTRLTPFRSLQPGQAYTCEGTIVGISPPPPGRSRAPLSAMLRDASGYATASWLNAGYLARVFTRGQRLVLHGKVGRYKGALVIQQPDWEIVESGEDDRLHTGRLVPVYSLTEGLPQRALRSLMWRVVDQFARDVPEALPDAVLRRRGLVGLARALGDAHFPETDAGLAAARRRLAFDDFLLLQLGLAILRSRTARARGIAMNPRGDLVRRLHASLPYTLTAAQERVWEEIRRDMAAPYPMHRLLQGDVGSGKTIVAALAVLTAIEAGYQAAVMAPTEILAEQHVMTFRQLLEPLGVGVTLLTSSVKPRESAARRAALAAGEVPCVVGTHALVQGGVEFRRLGLAVVDEQHRFGVEQRAKLRGKGEHPDLLVMTATPIPRTLALPPNGPLLRRFLGKLPFRLTRAQSRSMAEILRDLAQPHPMQRLLQGDVGSGKTIVAAIACLAAIDAGCQAAVMAPTEILAEQHLRKFSEWLAPLGVPIAWLHGGLTAAQKNAVVKRLKGAAPIVAIGTHALFQKKVGFARLALAVVDEQHRFGVQQRLALRKRGESRSAAVALAPHQLMMSATPIPRTLSMTYYADLDVSTIDELPPGRRGVATRLAASGRRAEVLARIRAACAEGQQAYWVCPVIEESKDGNLQTAVDTYESLRDELKGLRVGLLHGRLPADEKASVMEAFVQGRLNLLVATTVIEVGVDVPNASLMVIEHAERFGLAQLHQLRGRIGRGARESVCILLYAAPLSEPARARLKVIFEQSDGFEIARQDLLQRGPGEYLGERQSGMPLLRYADLEKDEPLVLQASEAAQALLAQDPSAARRHVERWLASRHEYLRA